MNKIAAILLCCALAVSLAACRQETMERRSALDTPSPTAVATAESTVQEEDLPNLTYTEEFELQGDPGDYLSAADAAGVVFETARDRGDIPEYSAGTQYTLTLIGLKSAEGEECYVYRLDDDLGSGARGLIFSYAYQSGNVYVQSKADAAWEAATGYYVQEQSSQYNNAMLQLKFLSEGCVLFELEIMEGSEDADTADTQVLCAVLLVGQDGVGRYETPPDSQEPYTLAFQLAEEGRKVSISHTGEMSMSPDGVYAFMDAGIEVSEASATALLEFLPTAATSLSSTGGAYTLMFSEDLIGERFLPVKAVLGDTGAVLAKFLIAEDMSAVYRVDDDTQATLIFGDAQPMPDAETLALFP